MIIQIRGTSGSGKSTAMRRVMDTLGDWHPIAETKRKKPLYYFRMPSDEYPPLFLLGHYESPCGGCDTIGSARQVFQLIQRLRETENRAAPEHRPAFLTEALLLSEDTKWSSQMEGLHILYLITSLDQCLANIKKRREQAGNERELNEENTRRRFDVIERSRVKLVGLGKTCQRCTSDQACGIVLRWLREYREGKR